MWAAALQVLWVLCVVHVVLALRNDRRTGAAAASRVVGVVHSDFALCKDTRCGGSAGTQVCAGMWALARLLINPVA
jgi:hypothetical protein